MEATTLGELEPLQVVLDFVSAVGSGTVSLTLADECILSFFGCECRGVFAAAAYLGDISRRCQHAGFQEAAEVRPGAEVILKERFGRSFDRRRRRLYEQKERQRAITMHLRLEPDDEVLPGRQPHQLVTPPRPACFDLDQLKFVEASGELVGSVSLLDCGKVHLTLGYRQAPLAYGQERPIEICLALYEKRAESGPEGVQTGFGSQVSEDPPAEGKLRD